MPVGTEVSSDGRFITLGGPKADAYQIPIRDFLDMVEYVLVISDLTPEDPRLRFLKRVRSLKVTAGFNHGKKRLAAIKKTAVVHKKHHKKRPVLDETTR